MQKLLKICCDIWLVILQKLCRKRDIRSGIVETYHNQKEVIMNREAETKSPTESNREATAAMIKAALKMYNDLKIITANKGDLRLSSVIEFEEALAKL